MFSKRTVAGIGAFSMIAAIAVTGHAQPRRHAKDPDTDTDPDPDQDTDADTARPKPRSKAKSRSRAKAKNVDPDTDSDTDTVKPKTKAKARSKAKAKPRDADSDSDGSGDVEAEREREKERERTREREQERAREKEAAEADAATDKAREDKAREDKAREDKARDTAKDKLAETEAQVTSGNGAGAGEAYQSGTLGFSIPISSIGAATGATLGEPPPTVDIVYFLDNTAALDLIVGLNVHRRHTVSPMGAASDSNLIGAAAGLGYRIYSSKNGLRSFLEPQAVVSLPDVSNTDSLTLKVGGVMGLERNITPWFSVSGAVGATVNVASTFKDIQLATTATLAANLYWR